MIDDSDGNFVLLAGSSGTGLAGLVVTLVIAAIVYAIAASNREDCGKRHCAAGLTPKVVDHECVCVGAPAEGTK